MHHSTTTYELTCTPDRAQRLLDDLHRLAPRTQVRGVLGERLITLSCRPTDRAGMTRLLAEPDTLLFFDGRVPSGHVVATGGALRRLVAAHCRRTRRAAA